MATLRYDVDVDTRRAEQRIGAFALDMRNRITAAVRALPEIELTADSTPAQRELAQVRRDLVALGRQRIGVDIDADDAQARLTELNARLEALRGRGDIQVDADVAAAVAALRVVSEEAASLDGDTIRINTDVDTGEALAQLAVLSLAAGAVADKAFGVRSLSGVFGQLGTVASGAAKSVMLVGKPLAILGAAGGAINVVAGVGTALAQLAPAALILPGALAAAGAAVATLKVGMANFGAAVTAANPAAFAKATEGMAPAALSAVNAMRTLKTEFVGVRQAVQTQLFAGVSAEIRSLGGEYLPILKTGLSGIAGELNKVGLGLANTLRAPDTAANVAAILDHTRQALQGMGPALGNVAHGFLELGAYGSSYLTTIGSGLTGLTQKFRDWITNGVESGKFDDAIAQAKVVFGQLGEIAKNVGSIVGHIFSGLSSGDAAAFLSNLVALTGALRGFFDEASTQTALSALKDALSSVSTAMSDVLIGALQQLGPIITAMAPVVANVAQIFSAVLLTAIQQLAPIVLALLPLINGLVTVLGGSLITIFQQLGPPILQIVSALTAALLPVLPMLGQALSVIVVAIAPLISLLQALIPSFSAIANAAGVVFTALGPVINLLAGVFAQVLTLLAPIIAQFATLFGTLLVSAIDALTPVLTAVIGAVLQVVSALAPLIPILLQVATQIIGALLPVLPLLVQMFLALVDAVLPLIPPLLQIVQAIAPILVSLISALMPVVGALGQAFITLVQALTPLLPSLLQLVVALLPALNLLLPLIAQILVAVVVPIIQLFAGALTGVITVLVSVIAGVADFVTAILTFFNNFGTNVTTIWNAVWGGIVSVVTTVWGAVTSFLASVVAGVVGFFTGVWTAILSVTTTVWGAISGFLTTVITAVVGFFVSAWNGIVAFFTGIWTAISNVVTTVWNAIAGYFVAVFNAHRELWMSIWNGIVAFFTGIWNAISSVATTVWNAIVAFFVGAFNFFVTTFTAVWNAVSLVFSLVWNAIKTIATTVWSAIAAFFTTAFALFQQGFAIVWNAISLVFSTVWNFIATVARTVWAGISSFFTGAFAVFQGIFAAVWNAISGVFSTVWNAISTVAKTVWGAISSFFTGAFKVFSDIFSGFWNGIVTAFQNIWGKVTGIAKGIWDGVSKVFRDGVNIVIDAINWLSDKVNVVLKFLLIPLIPAIPRLEAGGVVGQEQPQLLAAGGRIGGGFVTNGPQAIVGEGRQAHPEFVIPTDPQYRSRALGLYEQLGTRLMADGGILGWIGDAAGNVWNGISGAVGAVGGALSDVGRWVGGGVAGMISEVRDAIRTMLPAGPLGDIGGGIAGKALDGIRKMIEDAFAKQQTVNTGVPGGGAAQWAPVILRVLGELGQPANLLGAVERRINFESGGNPTAINLTDSNAKAGHPSQGLMQTIPSTFNAYAGPYVGLGITNPLANIYAGLNYAIHRYGSIAAIDPLVRPRGYDQGGIASGSGIMLKETLRPERVLSPDQTQFFESALSSYGQVGPSAAQAAGFTMQAQLESAVRAAVAEALSQQRPSSVGTTVNWHAREPLGRADLAFVASETARMQNWDHRTS